MSNLRIGYINLADSATITASPALATGSLTSFLQNDSRGDIAQASSTASQEIKGTWGGTAYTISQLALWRHNLTASDTIRLELYSDTAWTTGLWDSTALAAYTSGLFDDWGWAFTNRYFTPVASVKSFKITVAVVGSPGTPFEVARLYLGAYVEAPLNPAEGFQLGMGTNSKQSRSDSASLRSVRKDSWRTAAFDMMVQTEADRAAWFEIGRYCDISRSFVCSVFPGVGGTQERDFTFFAKFETPPAQKLYQNKHDFSMRIAEL